MKKTLICIAAIILNFLTASLFFNILKLPFFFDTIWTVAVVFWLGLVPGLCVAVGYNILNYLVWVLKSGAGNFAFLYSICGILIVFSTWMFSRKKEEFRFSPVVTILYLILIALVSSFCTIIAGGLIDYFQYTNYDMMEQMNPIKKFTDSFVRQKFSLLASCILAQIPISFTDRLITTFAGFGIYRLIQKFTKGIFHD
ncbi:hypothetical protein [Treponema sp.]|uniref:hypothetical protein n=1 Tax=Treponema sp. TaxID=166 RepID=UPI00298DAF6E|nr:hypothetical protein [Treponema sp.]MCQ2242266.1 hypothetical protein [Treponema sp.]